MNLVDTSVWIHYLRKGNNALGDLLGAGLVLTHSFVIGELALGHLRQREVVLDALSDLPRASAAMDAEALHFIDRHTIYGHGIGQYGRASARQRLRKGGSRLVDPRQTTS